MSEGITIDGLRLTTVNSKVSLAISVQVQPAKCEATVDWLLVNRRMHTSTMPLHLSGKTAIHGNESHSTQFLTSYFVASRRSYCAAPREVDFERADETFSS